MSQIKSDQRVRLNRLYSYLVEHLSTLYITSTLKSLQVIPVIWLDLIGAINSQIAPFFFCSKSHIFPSHCGSFTEMQQPIAYLKKPIKLQGYLYFKGILQGYLYYILYKNNKRKKFFCNFLKTNSPLDRPNIWTDWKIVYLKTSRKHSGQNTSPYGYALL